MKFAYEKYPAQPIPSHPKRTSTARPTIPIRLTNLDTHENRQYMALIDSGADYCIFHAEIGELIGLDVKAGKPLTFFGVGGVKQIAYFHNVGVVVGGWKYECYAGFSYDIDNLPYGLLGQDGFFDKFKVAFDLHKTEIELKENKHIKFTVHR